VAYTDELDDILNERDERLRREYRQDVGQKEFWDGFYSQNPQLRAHREIVSAVFAEAFNDLSDYPIADAMNELGERVQERVTYLEKTRHQREEQAAFVGGPGLENKPAGDQQFSTSRTMGSLIKERRAARRAATLGGGYRPASPTEAPSYGRRPL
jgi:hypothetical protein